MNSSRLLIVRFALLVVCWLAVVVKCQAQSLTILHTFRDGSVTNDGSSPTAPLVLGVDGNFYSVTESGGSSGQDRAQSSGSRLAHRLLRARFRPPAMLAVVSPTR